MNPNTMRLSRHQRLILLRLASEGGFPLNSATFYDVLWTELKPRWRLVPEGYRERVSTLPPEVRASLARTLSRLAGRGLIVRKDFGWIYLTKTAKALTEKIAEETS